MDGSSTYKAVVGYGLLILTAVLLLWPATPVTIVDTLGPLVLGVIGAWLVAEGAGPPEVRNRTRHWRTTRTGRAVITVVAGATVVVIWWDLTSGDIVLILLVFFSLAVVYLLAKTVQRAA